MASREHSFLIFLDLRTAFGLARTQVEELYKTNIVELYNLISNYIFPNPEYLISARLMGLPMPMSLTALATFRLRDDIIMMLNPQAEPILKITSNNTDSTPTKTHTPEQIAALDAKIDEKIVFAS